MSKLKSSLLLSGGLDSAVLLAAEIDVGENVHCYIFDYGQRHVKEIESAVLIARHYRCNYHVIKIPSTILRGSALTGHRAIPHAHHEDPVQVATVVPNRNAVMLSIAAARASRQGIDHVMFAAHSGDAAIYPDCRPEFVAVLNTALRFGCGVGVQAPFLEMGKRSIVMFGRILGVPSELTWSCYEGGETPCGQCGACRERNEAES